MLCFLLVSSVDGIRTVQVGQKHELYRAVTFMCGQVCEELVPPYGGRLSPIKLMYGMVST